MADSSLVRYRGLSYPNRIGYATLVVPMTTQATPLNALTRGTVASSEAGRLVLNVDNTSYQLHLDCAAALKEGESAQGSVILKARKVWTVSAGGSFINPIFGSPRMIQGIVKAVDGKRLVVQAGTPVCVELPDDRAAYDLKNGELVPGVMVNITTIGVARFEPAAG